MFGNKLSKVEKLTAKKKSEGLIALIRDKNEEVRLAAIRGLGCCEDDGAYNALVPLIHDSNASVRKTTIQALAAVGRPAGRVHIEHQMHQEKDQSVLAVIQTALSTLKEKY